MYKATTHIIHRDKGVMRGGNRMAFREGVQGWCGERRTQKEESAAETRKPTLHTIHTEPYLRSRAVLVLLLVSICFSPVHPLYAIGELLRGEGDGGLLLPPVPASAGAPSGDRSSL